MRILPSVKPTPEQLKILADTKPGYALIRGAAGSGKTTTALLRLQQLCAVRLSRHERLGLTTPVRVLVLTYNRTLEGYISELARQQVAGHHYLQLEVSTFGKWAYNLLGCAPEVLNEKAMANLIRPYAAVMPWDEAFLIEEVDYLLGRFEPASFGTYLTVRRGGRGTSPRVDQALRRKLMDQVVTPYTGAKKRGGVMDWHDVAVAAKAVADVPPWDIVIIDEAQDFSANQVRAVLTHLAEESSLTFVMDAMQRIYPRYFTWAETGIARFVSTYTLARNYRNTKQIAAFARPIVEGLAIDDDGALPDFEACDGDGPLPAVVAGRFSRQVDFIIGRLLETVDFGSESVAFLHPKGGGWFDYLRERLRKGGLPYAELSRSADWPAGPEAIALCTLSSAKGLEFDHVILPGLNSEVTPHGSDDGDAQFDSLRRLIAMGVGRARKSVILGFNPDDPSAVLQLLQPGTFEMVSL